MIGIIGALTIEVDALVERMAGKSAETIAGVEYISGALYGKNAVVCKCGVGKVNAAVCTQTMILKYAPELIINTGVGGGLDAELSVLDIVVGDSAVQHDFDASAFGDPVGYMSILGGVRFPLDERASNALMRSIEDLGLRCARGIVATGDQFIGSAAAKARIRDAFSAKACDMEGCAIAHACYLSGVNCAILRAISDGADEGAGMSFQEFAPKAAEQSLRVIMRFLEAYA